MYKIKIKGTDGRMWLKEDGQLIKSEGSDEYSVIHVVDPIASYADKGAAYDWNQERFDDLNNRRNAVSFTVNGKYSYQTFDASDALLFYCQVCLI